MKQIVEQTPLAKNSTIIFIDGIDGIGKSAIIRRLESIIGSDVDLAQAARHIPYIQSTQMLRSHDYIEAMSGVGRVIYDVSTKRGRINYAELVMRLSDKTMRNFIPHYSHDCDVVLVDRSRASFVAYQLHAMGLSKEFEDAFANAISMDEKEYSSYSHLVYLEHDKKPAKLPERDQSSNCMDEYSLEHYDDIVAGYDWYMSNCAYGDTRTITLASSRCSNKVEYDKMLEQTAIEIFASIKPAIIERMNAEYPYTYAKTQN